MGRTMSKLQEPLCDGNGKATAKPWATQQQEANSKGFLQPSSVTATPFTGDVASTMAEEELRVYDKAIARLESLLTHRDASEKTKEEAKEKLALLEKESKSLHAYRTQVAVDDSELATPSSLSRRGGDARLPSA